MKKKILFILALSAVLSACKMKLSENTGTVLIDFESTERAVGSNGLPIIKDAEMSLEINSLSKGSLTADFSSDQEKIWSGSFPVGEKLTINVKIITSVGRWKGSAEHTVTAGTNNVSVKLKKSAVALNSLLFSTNKPDSGSATDYTLTLKIGSKEVKKERIRDHSLCRDNKGRTYLAYNTAKAWNIERYTSEGNKEDKNFPGFLGDNPLILASDHETGSVYLAVKIGWYALLYRIKEDGSTEKLKGSVSCIEGYAVHNNILISHLWESSHQVLKIYRINGDSFSEIRLPNPPNLEEDIKIMLGVSAVDRVSIKDIYMTSDSIYVLFSQYQHNKHPAEYYSLGGIVKYSYTADGTNLTISNPVRIGIDDKHTPDGNGIYHTDESNFYCPVKVIGFDEENLYIADDGIEFEYQKGKPRLSANKNRIAVLNKENNGLTFTDTPSGITWMSENPVWTGVSTKTIVWTKNSSNYGFDYYQITQAADTLPSAAFEVGGGQTVGSDHKFTDVFCYDEAGNLYIVRNQGGGHCICRFELQDDGSYNTAPAIMDNAPQHPPVAIAVDISGSVKTADGNSANALYYSYDGSNQSNIERFTWGKNAAFSDAAADTSFGAGGVFAGPTDTKAPSQTETRFTALAADKNGFFIGETYKNIDNNNYVIRVKKYAHTAAGYNRPESTIEVVSPSSIVDSQGGKISENLNALYIQDGILFGVTAKEFRNNYDSYDFPQEVSISGRLWKIGKTDAAFTADTLKRLHSSEPSPWPGDDNGKRKEGGKFAPYRFIAVKPKELIIASDGFYGWVEGIQKKAAQYNFIWTFELKADGSTGESNSADKGPGITFSKELEADSNFTWK